MQPLSFTLPQREFDELPALAPRALLVGREDPGGPVRSVPAGFMPDPTPSSAPLDGVVSQTSKAMPSGGNTGRPRQSASTDDSCLDPSRPAAVFGIQPDQTMLVTGPLTHNTPPVSTLTGRLFGHHVILTARFDAEECLGLIGRYRASWMTTVPTVLQRLSRAYQSASDAYDLSSLRRLWHMAAPCPPAVKQAWIDILGPGNVWELYGGTEMQAITMIDGAQWLTNRGSVGPVALGHMKVLDENGRESDTGAVGEIRRPSIPRRGRDGVGRASCGAVLPRRRRTR